MAYTPIKPEELKKLIKMSKTRPLNYGYNPGPKGADLLILDKILAADKLGRTAKKEGEGTKASHGVFQVDGRELTLKTETPLPEMARKMRKYLKTLNYSFSVAVVDPSGNMLERDLSEEDEDVEAAAPPPPPPPPPPGQAKATAPDAQPDQKAPGEQAAPGEKPSAEEAAKKEAAAQEPAAEAAAESQDDSNDQNAVEDKLDTARRAALTDRVRKLQAPVNALGTGGAPFKKAIGVVVPMLKNGELDKVDATLGKIEEGVKKATDAKAKKEAAPDLKQEAEAAASPDVKKEAETAAKAPDPKALVARAGSLKSALADLPGAQSGAIKKQLLQALALVKSRDFAAADAALTEAENAMNALPKVVPAAEDTQAPGAAAEQVTEDLDDQETAEQQAEVSGQEAAEQQAEAPVEEAAPNPAAEAWAARLKVLQADVDAAMQAKKGKLDTINRTFNYAKSQADAGAYDSALAAAEQTQRLLDQAKDVPDDAPDARVAEAQQSIPDNTVAYQKSRLAWIDTRNSLIADLMKLEMAINTAAKSNESMQGIAEQTSDLVHYVDDIDSSLEDAMDELVNAPLGPQRDSIRDKAIKIIQDYRATLDDDFFKAVDDNGFTQTNIRGRALDALSQIESTLAA